MAKSLYDIVVGDKIRVKGEIILRGKIDEIRTVAKVTKTLIIDDKGWKWKKRHGSPKGGSEYPTVYIDAVEE